MARIYFSDSPAFDGQFMGELLKEYQDESSAIAVKVAEIISAIRIKGDNALIDYTHRFDGVEYTASTLPVTKAEIEKALAACSKDLIESLKFAAKRIESYHRRQLPKDERYTDEAGVTLGWKWTAVESAGLYVPGGTAAYPSSVLMNAIPAKVAGVNRISMVTPTPKGQLNPAVLAAAHIAGITEIYKIGGAQAVAALAFGTETIPAVDKIVGPGNAYVAEAKRQVFGMVGIDTIAGPSEIVVIADRKAKPAWIAADLLSQAEHDVLARSILITDSEVLAKQVIKEVEAQLNDLPRRDIAMQSWSEHGAVIVVKNMEEAIALSNQIAPEHVELMMEHAESYIAHITNAGAIFVGAHSPEPIGDYTAGPSHVLPTSGAARFSSGLSVLDFLKRSSIIHSSASAFQKLAEATETLANQEGLSAHARSVSIRKN